MRRLGLLAVAVVLAGCNGSEPESQGPQGGTTTAPPTTAPGTTGAASSTRAVRLYFIQGDRLVATTRRVGQTAAVGRAALDALAEGPTEEERELGFSTQCSRDAVDGGLSIREGKATVDGLPADGGCMAQAVWTLTQFPTVETVNGNSRKEVEQFAPAILVDSPAPYEEIRSPLRVTGTANTFEATFQYELTDWDGRIIEHDFVTATSGSGERGTFDFTIEFDTDRAGVGELIVFEASAADGSRIHIREIPLRLVP